MTTPRHIRIALVLAICTGDIPADIHAEPLPGDWQVSVPLSLSTNTLLRADGDATVTLHSVSASTGLDLSSSRSPWSGGVFVDRHFSHSDEADGIVNAGAFVMYRFGRWDTSAVVLSSHPRGASAIWLYGNALRFRVADGHKLGIQAVAPGHNPESTTVMLRYDGTLSRRLSLSIAAGNNLAAGQHRVASIELSWDVF
jgi:hypothetical protein